MSRRHPKLSMPNQTNRLPETRSVSISSALLPKHLSVFQPPRYLVEAPRIYLSWSPNLVLQPYLPRKDIFGRDSCVTGLQDTSCWCFETPSWLISSLTPNRSQVCFRNLSTMTPPPNPCWQECGFSIFEESASDTKTPSYSVLYTVF